uniref:Uncharacterized protein n=1 Tax=Pseudomonas aeruginosa TaxID=287 RepID=A0A6C0L3V0_PSEAI|nr:hypothetical protein [Pseudomonas aeruginosa]
MGGLFCAGLRSNYQINNRQAVLTGFFGEAYDWCESVIDQLDTQRMHHPRRATDQNGSCARFLCFSKGNFTKTLNALCDTFPRRQDREEKETTNLLKLLPTREITNPEGFEFTGSFKLGQINDFVGIAHLLNSSFQSGESPYGLPRMGRFLS